MIFSTVNLLALAALLVLFLVSLRWVFGASRPRKARSMDVVHGTQRTDGTWDRAGTRRRDLH